jgi:hypothetical protein
MKQSGHQESLLSGMRPPAAPVSLKARVLAAARSAYREPRPTFTDRLWSNRSLQLAWGMATVALLLINLNLAGSQKPAGNDPALPPTALAWQCVSSEDQLQPPARRSGSSPGLSLQEFDKLLFEGLSDSSTDGEKKAAQEGD